MGIEELFEDTLIKPYVPPPPGIWEKEVKAFGGRTAHVVYKRERMVGIYRVLLTKTKGGSMMVSVYDESRGRSKLIGRAGGLESYEAEEIYRSVIDKLEEIQYG